MEAVLGEGATVEVAEGAVKEVVVALEVAEWVAEVMVAAEEAVEELAEAETGAVGMEEAV